MRKINPYFLIGTLGILWTSLGHILIAALSSQEIAAEYLVMGYPLFSLLLLIGAGVMIKNKEKAI